MTGNRNRVRSTSGARAQSTHAPAKYVHQPAAIFVVVRQTLRSVTCSVLPVHFYSRGASSPLQSTLVSPDESPFGALSALRP